jgi:hypothetical protein
MLPGVGTSRDSARSPYLAFFADTRALKSVQSRPSFLCRAAWVPGREEPSAVTWEAHCLKARRMQVLQAVVPQLQSLLSSFSQLLAMLLAVPLAGAPAAGFLLIVRMTVGVGVWVTAVLKWSATEAAVSDAMVKEVRAWTLLSRCTASAMRVEVIAPDSSRGASWRVRRPSSMLHFCRWVGGEATLCRVQQG